MYNVNKEEAVNNYWENRLLKREKELRNLGAELAQHKIKWQTESESNREPV